MQFRLRTLLLLVALCAVIIFAAKWFFTPHRPELRIASIGIAEPVNLSFSVPPGEGLKVQLCRFTARAIAQVKATVYAVQTGEEYRLGYIAHSMADQVTEGVLYVAFTEGKPRQLTPMPGQQIARQFTELGIQTDRGSGMRKLSPLVLETPALINSTSPTDAVTLTTGQASLLWSFYWPSMVGDFFRPLNSPPATIRAVIDHAKANKDITAVFVVVETW